MSDDKEKKCVVCGKGGPEVKACSQCKKVYYCGKDHQRDDWKSHKKNCKAPVCRNGLVHSARLSFACSAAWCSEAMFCLGVFSRRVMPGFSSCLLCGLVDAGCEENCN